MGGNDIINETSTKLEDLLTQFYNNQAFQRSITGARSAWRGYELQTLYICSRLVNDKGQECRFYPETAEDLLVEIGPGIVELIQIKAKDRGLVLSDILPTKSRVKGDGEDSLIGHARYFLERGYKVTARVVVFGSLGNELVAFGSGDPASRRSVLNKIGLHFGDEMVAFSESGLRFESVDEADLLDGLKRWAEARVEIRAYPPIVLDHLSVRVRSLSLEKGYLTQGQIENDVRKLGLKLAAVSGIERQYGNTIIPLAGLFDSSTTEDVADEYRAGASARPIHITKGLDVKRPRWINKIETAFQGSRFVIVRGASGQGKSTICYRFIHDSGAVQHSYLIAGLASLEDARDICSFMVALSETEEDAIHYVYVDGASGEGWVWLAQQLYVRSKPNIRMLVSIREDDYAAANLSAKDFLASEIVLNFSEDEAHAIYDNYKQKKFPSFEESWKTFGEEGPLMEYTYSLSVGSSLRSKLGSQIGRLVDKNDDAWVYALYLASLAGSEGLKTSLAALRQVTGCKSIAHFVKSVNREHLLRGGQDGEIGPLHPYRSAIIAEILSEYCFESPNDVAGNLVKCSIGDVGSLLVSWHSKHRDGDLRMETLVRASGDSWSKISEVLKYAIWLDARHVYCASSDLDAEFISRRITSWFPFTISGGITKMFEVSDSDVLLELARDDQWRATLKSLLERAAKYRITYDASTLALRAVELPSLGSPDSAKEMESAGFCLTQHAACGCIDDDVASSARRLAEGFIPCEWPLSPQLDYAMGLQLCGATLKREAYDKLEKGVNARHSIVWYKKTSNAVDALQVPHGNGDDLNSELVDALADYRRLYPDLDMYCGAQIGTDAFVPSDRMPPVEKHIPARNLPIHWLNVADRMFIEMCSYDDAIDDWHSVRSIVEDAISLFDRAIRGITKWLDKCFDKGTVVSMKPALIDDIRTLSSRESQKWAVVDTPRSMRDPMGFRNLISPVDQRGARKADGDPVRQEKASTGPLATTSKLMSNAESLGQRLCDFVLALSNGDAETAKHAARSGVYLIKLVIDVFHEARHELMRLFDTPILREDLELDIVVLAGVLSHVAESGIRHEHSVAYDSKLRARRLMSAESVVVKSVSWHPSGRASASEQNTNVVSVDLSINEADSIEGVLSEAVGSCFKKFDDAEHLSEFFLFPHYCRSLNVNLLYNDAYFGTVRFGGYQLERMAAGELDVLYLPPETPVPSEGFQDAPIAKPLRFIGALSQLCKYCSSVNGAISRKEQSVVHLVDSEYADWKQRVEGEVSAAIDGLRDSMSSLPQWAAPVISVVADLEDYCTLIPDAADASELLTALETVQNELLRRYLTFGQDRVAPIVEETSIS